MREGALQREEGKGGRRAGIGRGVGQEGRVAAAGARGGHLREGQREVEALPQAPEHDKRAGREGASRHLAARALEGAARGALAAEPAVGPVRAGAPVAADAGHAASGLRVQLAVLPWRWSRGQRRSPRRGPSAPQGPGLPGGSGAQRHALGLAPPTHNHALRLTPPIPNHAQPDSGHALGRPRSG